MANSHLQNVLSKTVCTANVRVPTSDCLGMTLIFKSPRGHCTGESLPLCLMADVEHLDLLVTHRLIFFQVARRSAELWLDKEKIVIKAATQGGLKFSAGSFQHAAQPAMGGAVGVKVEGGARQKGQRNDLRRGGDRNRSWKCVPPHQHRG